MSAENFDNPLSQSHFTSEKLDPFFSVAARLKYVLNLPVRTRCGLRQILWIVCVFMGKIRSERDL